MDRTPAADKYADAMGRIIDGISTGDEESYAAAAAALEEISGTGEMPRGDEFYATVFSALCYDLAGMRRGAARMYGLFEGRYSGELEYVTLSAAHSRRLVGGMAALGAGDGGRSLALALDDAHEWLYSKASSEGKIDHLSPDDYRLFFALLSLLRRFFRALRGSDPGGSARELARTASGFYDDLVRYHPEPLLGFMVSLYLRLIEATYERAVARLGLGDGAREALWDSGRYALAGLERDAVAAGLLERKRLVCRLPGWDEKPMLACLCLGASRGAGAVAYLAATGRGVKRAHAGISRLIGYGGGQGRAHVGDGHLVCTYRELGMRLLSGDARAGDIGTVIIDEACDLEEECGEDAAMELDMLLARLRAAGSDCPQIVALTTRASAAGAEKMASWIGARSVGGGSGAAEAGRGMDRADESVYYGGMLYAVSQPCDTAPPPRDLFHTHAPDGPQDAALLCALFSRRAAVSDSPVLISVPEEVDALAMADGIASHLRELGKGDLDMAEASERAAGARRALADHPAIRSGLEYCGAGIEMLLGSGIAFDDKRLPQPFRAAVMDGVAGGAVSTVVSSSVPDEDAGPSPFKTVVFCSPDPAGAGAEATPRSILPGPGRMRAWEMAGRPGRDKRGEVFAVAETEAERDLLLRTMRGRDTGACIAQGMRRDGPRRPSIASHLVRMAREDGGATLADMLDRVSQTWLWTTSDSAGRAALAGAIKDDLEELVALNLVAIRGDGGGGAEGGCAYEATGLGVRLCESNLPALQAARAVRALRESTEAGGALATRFYEDVVRAARSVGGFDQAFTQAAASDDESGRRETHPAARMQGTGGGGGAGTGQRPSHHSPGNGAESGHDMPSLRIVAAKASAAATARILLEIANIMHDADRSASAASEKISSVAIRCMHDYFENAADLWRYCLAQTERGRAAFLVDRLAESPPSLMEIGGQVVPTSARASRIADSARASTAMPAGQVAAQSVPATLQSGLEGAYGQLYPPPPIQTRLRAGTPGEQGTRNGLYTMLGQAPDSPTGAPPIPAPGEREVWTAASASPYT